MPNKQRVFEIKQNEIEIETLTGLYIGAGKTGMRIGGVDNEFIRNPVNDEPYIPGSSLKGKVRSLLEYYSGLLAVSSKGNVLSVADITKAKSNKDLCSEKDMEDILKLFGTSASSNKQDNKEQNNQSVEKYGITRLLFSDLYLNKDNKDTSNNTKTNDYDLTKIFEVKPETTINRFTGKAEHPRFTERVVAGTKFTGTITLKVFNQDDENKFITLLKIGLKLLELDALGGSSSRGYGKVSITFNGEKLPSLEDLEKIKEQ